MRAVDVDFFKGKCQQILNIIHEAVKDEVQAVAGGLNGQPIEGRQVISAATVSIGSVERCASPPRRVKLAHAW
jgi:hypothetical protein